MPRLSRKQILYNNCYAHVYARALEKYPVFEEPDDFEYFKNLLLFFKKKNSFRIFHYCLMHTHFHLAVQIQDVDVFSKGMKAIKQQYAVRVREEKKKEGPVWWGRFGSQLIENDQYLYACGLYIEQNPVKAGLVNQPEKWGYSSSAHYFLGTPDPLIDPYERPSRKIVDPLVRKLNLEKGAYVGSSLGQLYAREMR